MIKCPNCFQDLPADLLAFVCKHCPPVEDPALSVSRGVRSGSGPVLLVERPAKEARWTPPELVACPGCHRNTGTMVCPNCHYELTTAWRSGRAVCLALAGARATGKTVYIAVLIKLLEMLAESMHSPLRPVGRTLHIYKEFYEPFLLRARSLPGATPRVQTENSPQIEPLIWSIGQINGVEHHIVIRDAAGEELEAASQAGHLGFFAHASLVLFLFDPTHVPEVRNQLADHLSTNQRVGGDPATVLTNLLSLMGRGRHRLGIALSKFDTMQAFAQRPGSLWQQVMLNTGAAFRRDSQPGLPYYDEHDGGLLDQEIRSMLRRLHAGRIVLLAEEPPAGLQLESRFFAVSALGFEPVGSNVHAHGIAPFRVLDPIRWALADEGVIGRV